MDPGTVKVKAVLAGHPVRIGTAYKTRRD